MTEIPTTGQIRHGYSIVDGGLNDTWLREDAEKRFDWWLAEVIAQACTHTFAQQLEEHSLAELIRMAKADGFDEGWDARVNAETITPTENPYRQGEEQ